MPASGELNSRNNHADERIVFSRQTALWPWQGEACMTLRPSDVWLRLYQLAEAFEARGAADDERVRVVMQELLAMPPELQKQSLARLELMSRLASEVAAASKAETPGPE
jgi:hypothetical protein